MYAVLALAVVAVFTVWFDAMAVVVGLTFLGFVIASLFDLFVLWRTSLPIISRTLPHTLTVGRKIQIALKVKNSNSSTIRLKLFDFTPPSFERIELPLSGEVAAGESTEFGYSVCPRERGQFNLVGFDVRLLGPIGLWWRQAHSKVSDTVKVYPDFKRLSHYAMNVEGRPLNWWRARRTEKGGVGTEFHQLREYRPGDQLRQINWKATARHQRVISAEYEEERDQTVMILMDCGRRMRSRDDNKTYFDHALDAVLLLAYTALRQGDAVGFAAFNGDARAQAPAKGNQTFHALLNRIYDLQPSSATFDFMAAARRLIESFSKRSLVVIVTQIGTEDLSDLIDGVRLLGQYHRVMIVTLRDQQTETLHGVDVEQLDQAVFFGAAQRYLDERDHALEKLRREGVVVVDALPAELPTCMVNRYREVKRAGPL